MNDLEQKYNQHLKRISSLNILNKNAISTFFGFTWKIHNTNTLKQNYLSHLKLLAQDKNNFCSYFAEFHFLFLLNKILKDKNNLNIHFLSARDNLDFEISLNGYKFYVEVKTIIQSKLDKALNSLFSDIKKIPSGKIIRIGIKDNKGWESIFGEIIKILQKYGIKNFSNKNFVIRVSGEIKNKNKTGIVGPSYGVFVNESDLKKLIEKKLNEKSSQTKKADIVAIYSYDLKYASNNFNNVLNNILESKKYSNIKFFLWIDYWNQNQIQIVK